MHATQFFREALDKQLAQRSSRLDDLVYMFTSHMTAPAPSNFFEWTPEEQARWRASQEEKKQILVEAIRQEKPDHPLAQG